MFIQASHSPALFYFLHISLFVCFNGYFQFQLSPYLICPVILPPPRFLHPFIHPLLPHSCKLIFHHWLSGERAAWRWQRLDIKHTSCYSYTWNHTHTTISSTFDKESFSRWILKIHIRHEMFENTTGDGGTSERTGLFLLGSLIPYTVCTKLSIKLFLLQQRTSLRR